MSPIGIPSGWEMTEDIINWPENSVVSPYVYWFFFGDHRVHPNSEC